MVQTRQIASTKPRRLRGSGRTVYPLSTFTVGGRAYVVVLTPYTEIERRGARNGRSAHLQAVREAKLPKGTAPKGERD